MDAAARIEVDRREEEAAPDDVFVLTMDGMHDVLDMREALDAIGASVTPQAASKPIAQATRDTGDTGDLTVQVVWVETVPPEGVNLIREAEALPLSAPPRPGDVIDGLRAIRPLHARHRSHIHLLQGPGSTRAAMTIPTTDLREEPEAMRHLRWRAESPGGSTVLMCCARPTRPARARSSTFSPTSSTTGPIANRCTTIRRRRWTPCAATSSRLSLGCARSIGAKNLHQDLQPENVMIMWTDPRGSSISVA